MGSAQNGQGVNCEVGVVVVGAVAGLNGGRRKTYVKTTIQQKSRLKMNASLEEEKQETSIPIILLSSPTLLGLVDCPNERHNCEDGQANQSLHWSLQTG